MSASLESILEAINQLLRHEQRQLARKLSERRSMTTAEKEKARALVRELAGSAQGDGIIDVVSRDTDLKRIPMINVWEPTDI